jgi:hypothetical protein
MKIIDCHNKIDCSFIKDFILIEIQMIYLILFHSYSLFKICHLKLHPKLKQSKSWSDVGLQTRNRGKPIINWSSTSTNLTEEFQSKILIQKKAISRRQETSLLMPHSIWIANRNQFFRKQPCQLLRACLKDIMELSLHMDRQEQERLSQCKVLMTKPMKIEVLCPDQSTTSSKPFQKQPILKNISWE